MSSGVNVEKVDALKIELLDYIESINSISNKLELDINTIQSNIDGYGKQEILKKLGQVKEQLPNVTANIATYIDDLSKVVSSYQSLDEEAARTLISNIGKLGEGRD